MQLPAVRVGHRAEPVGVHLAIEGASGDHALDDLAQTLKRDGLGFGHGFEVALFPAVAEVLVFQAEELLQVLHGAATGFDHVVEALRTDGSVGLLAVEDAAGALRDGGEGHGLVGFVEEAGA